MANLSVSVDTENKNVSVTLNGKSIPDVDDVSVYTYRDSDGNVAGVELSVYTVKIQDDVRVRTSYYSSGSEKADTVIAALGEEALTDIDGFIGVPPELKFRVDVMDYMKNKPNA